MRLSRWALAGLALAVGAPGCSLSLGSNRPGGPVNTCGSSSDCAAGATCVQDRCVATRYDLGGLLLEVRLRADASSGASTAHVLDPSAAGVLFTSPSAGGQPFDVRFDVPLSAPVSVKGAKVVLDDPSVLDKSCHSSDGSVPAAISFYRLPRFAGLPADTVTVTSTQVGTTGVYTFDLDLVSDPGDRYDVYIMPTLGPDCPTLIPPYFLPAQTIDAKSTTFHLPKSGTIEANLQGLTGTGISAWQLDLLEPSRGLPISTGNTVTSSGSGSAQVTAQLSALDPSAWPILRLTPVDPKQPDPKPADPTRPTVYFSLHGAIVGGTKDSPVVDLGVGDLPATPVPVKGHVLGSDGISSVPSRFTIQSRSLQGPNAHNATYSTDSVVTDGSGAFEVDLPPGDYWVRAFPVADSALSITDHSLDWPSNQPTSGCVCGVSIQLQGKADLAGAISSPSGQPLPFTFVGVAPSIDVSGTPSQSVANSYLQNTLSFRPLSARVESASTDDTGAFSLLVDLGTVDLSVEPDPSTDLPWLVHPALSREPGQKPVSLSLPNSAFLSGVVRDAQGRPVANADVVAWFPVRGPTDPTALTGAVVKIAAATTDANGLYRLVLPASVAGQPSAVFP